MKPGSFADRMVVFVAQGFGLGCLPVAPGTFGTLLGFAWIQLLLVPGSVLVYIVGTILGLAASIWIGGKAEKILNVKDPGSIVIDEWTALPVTFAGVLVAIPKFTTLADFPLLPLIATFAAFRLFDITKPLFIRGSQNLPGGFGLTIDDLLAALFAAPLAWLSCIW